MSTSAQTYPIVLAHGIARFDFLRESFKLNSRKLFGDAFDNVLLHLQAHGIPTDRLHYFRGVLSFLKADGFDVHHSNVSFAKGLETRANDLKGQVQRILDFTGAKKVHVIAHSMGGLDSRFMIAKLGAADIVASLTTIGTPHLGTSFADFGLSKGGTELIERVGRVIDLRGFGDLSTEACRKFNESIRNAEAATEVFYQTYSAAEERKLVFNLLQPARDIINKAEGDNDGLVPVTSQAWQTELRGDDGTVKQIAQKRFPIPADHLNEVGWWDLNEIHADGPFHGLQGREHYETAIKQIYLDIARDLRTRFPL